MKARVLKNLIQTKYQISNHDTYIAIGSPMCHNLISLDKNTLKIKYALDTFSEGRKALEKDMKAELLAIWDKLQDLVDTGKIHEIINGKDTLENPLPVYMATGGKIKKSFTDKYGWPNIDDEGNIMYKNTHFATLEEAVKKGINENQAGIELTEMQIKHLEQNLKKEKELLEMHKKNIESLSSITSNDNEQ